MLWGFAGDTLVPPPPPLSPEEDSDADGWVWIGGLAREGGAGQSAGRERELPESPQAAMPVPAPAEVGLEAAEMDEVAPSPAPPVHGSNEPSCSRGGVVVEAQPASCSEPAKTGEEQRTAGPPDDMLPSQPPAPAQDMGRGEQEAASSSNLAPPPSHGVRAREQALPEDRPEKARRVMVQAPETPLAAAQRWMVGSFGEGWRDCFHASHRLSLAAPLVYCRRCGHHCEEARHLISLRARCEEPPRGSVYFSRLRSIEAGKHPTKKEKRLLAAVPLPPGRLVS